MKDYINEKQTYEYDLITNESKLVKREIFLAIFNIEEQEEKDILNTLNKYEEIFTLR